MKKYIIKFQYVFFGHWRTHTLCANTETEKASILENINKNNWQVIEITEVQE